MPVTSYYDVGGEILGQEVSGTRLDYLMDALGSVVSVVDQAKTVTHTARYKPYGSDLVTSNPGPIFGWVGSLGYREAGLSYGEHYTRARHFGDGEGRWRSIDPLWPDQRAYGYASSNPTTRVDPSGRAPLGCEEADCCEAQYKSSEPWCGGSSFVDCDEGAMISECKGDRTEITTKMCADMAAYLQGAIDTCNHFGSGKTYGDMSGEFKILAVAPCCKDSKGKQKSCGYKCCPGGSTGRACVDMCVVRHEQAHVRDCRNGGNPASPSGETCGYLTQANCLFNMFSSSCGWSKSKFPGFGTCIDYGNKYSCKARTK